MRGQEVHFIPSFSFPPPPTPHPVSEGRQCLDRDAGFLNDTDEDLADYRKSSKLSELYSATVPSIDSAMSSWDSSGFDAGYSSQGRPDRTPVVFGRPVSGACSDRRCFQGRTFTKPPIYCSTQTSGTGANTGARLAPAPQASCTIQQCMMADSLRMSGINYLGRCAHTHSPP